MQYVIVLCDEDACGTEAPCGVHGPFDSKRAAHDYARDIIDGTFVVIEMQMDELVD